LADLPGIVLNTALPRRVKRLSESDDVCPKPFTARRTRVELHSQNNSKHARVGCEDSHKRSLSGPRSRIFGPYDAHRATSAEHIADLQNGARIIAQFTLTWKLWSSQVTTTLGE